MCVCVCVCVCVCSPISESEVINSVWIIVDAVNHGFLEDNRYPNVEHGNLPKHNPLYKAFINDLHRLEVDFRAISPLQCWEGQTLAIDGCIIPIRNPGEYTPTLLLEF